jgi:hypothetical protein
VLRLTADDVCLVLGEDRRGLPVVLHFGATLSETTAEQLQATLGTAPMNSAFDRPSGPSVAASQADGWSGTPAFEWHADGRLPAALTAAVVDAGPDRVVFALSEGRTGGRILLRYRLHPTGALEATAELQNEGNFTRCDGAEDRAATT